MNVYLMAAVALLCMVWIAGMVWAFRWTSGMGLRWRSRLWLVLLGPITWLLSYFVVVQ